MSVETQVCTCRNRFFCQGGEIGATADGLHSGDTRCGGRRGKDIPKLSGKRTELIFSERDKEVPPCILCVYFGCAPEGTSFLFCLLRRPDPVSGSEEESVSVMGRKFLTGILY